MKLVIGLGNPGKEYVPTRHNIGCKVVSRLAGEAGVRIAKKGFSSLWAEGKLEEADVLFLLPQTFMNLSGKAVREIKDDYGVEEDDLVVVHDDLDLPLGRIKLAFDAGPAGHRGVLSIINALGTKGFYRLRIGIGRPSLKEEVEHYVLSPFGDDEKEKVEGVLKEGTTLLKNWVLKEEVP